MEPKFSYSYLHIVKHIHIYIYINNVVMYYHHILIIYHWILVLNDNCNRIWFVYDAHHLVIVQSYSFIQKGVCHHVVNLACRYMYTWYTCFWSIIQWHSSPTGVYIASILLSHLFLCFAICAFGLCQVFGVVNYYVPDKFLIPRVAYILNTSSPIHDCFQI